MLASGLIFILKIYYIINEANFDLAFLNPLVIISIISFSLFFGRIFWGDTNFSQMSGQLGLNTIFHSKNIFLRNKRFIDSIILSIQGSGFLLLAYNTQQSTTFFGVFLLVININIVWLVFQKYCFDVYKKCIKQKFELSLSGYNKKKFLYKDNRTDKLVSVVNIWLFNNAFLNILAGIVYFTYPTNEIAAIYIGLFFTIINSLIDFILTGHFYSQPETFLFGNRFYKNTKASKVININELHNLISNNKIDSLLELLITHFTRIKDIDSLNFILLKKSSYNEFSNHLRKGVITYEQYTFEKTKLTNSLIELISKLNNPLLGDGG